MPINQEKLDQIKEAVDIETLLLSLGFKVTRDTSYELRAPCALHGGDNPTAFSIRLDTRRWRCFTRKCELDRAGEPNNDLVSLIMMKEGVGFRRAAEILADYAGIPLEEDDSPADVEASRNKEINSFVKTRKKLKENNRKLPRISEDKTAEYMLDQDDYFLQQGFLPETLFYFEIGSMVDRYGTPRATIPIRDEDGFLVGMSARRKDSDVNPRYLLEFEFQKGKVLYNIHNAINTGSDTVILVEGFKAAWAVYEAGFKNVAACMGAAISKDQYFLLNKVGFINVILMFDGDEAGISGMDAAMKLLDKGFNTIPAYLPENVSPDDLSREELSNFLKRMEQLI